MELTLDIKHRSCYGLQLLYEERFDMVNI